MPGSTPPAWNIPVAFNTRKRTAEREEQLEKLPSKRSRVSCRSSSEDDFGFYDDGDNSLPPAPSSNYDKVERAFDRVYIDLTGPWVSPPKLPEELVTLGAW